MASDATPDPRAALADLIRRFDGRAAGLWTFGEGTLSLAAFVAADDLPAEVASGFPEATRTVPLDRPDLAIVRAAMERGPVLTRAENLPAEGGSGYWLRAFGATCSVAVPIPGPDGRLAVVLSVALRRLPGDAILVADVIRRVGLPLAHSQAPSSNPAAGLRPAPREQ